MSGSFALLLVSRAAMGAAAAGARVVTVALVRDCYSGRAMARVMSLAIIVFMAAPILAPNFGQYILYVGSWRLIFWGIGGAGASVLLWFWLQAYLPKLPYFNKLILTTTSGDVAPSAGSESVPAAPWPSLGSRGRAMTDLRPGGTAAFHDPALNDARTADVISDTGFVRAGTEVVVREVQGNRIVVRAT